MTVDLKHMERHFIFNISNNKKIHLHSIAFFTHNERERIDKIYFKYFYDS